MRPHAKCAVVAAEEQLIAGLHRRRREDVPAHLVERTAEAVPLLSRRAVVDGHRRVAAGHRRRGRARIPVRARGRRDQGGVWARSCRSRAPPVLVEPPAPTGRRPPAAGPTRAAGPTDPPTRPSRRTRWSVLDAGAADAVLVRRRTQCPQLPQSTLLLVVSTQVDPHRASVRARAARSCRLLLLQTSGSSGRWLAQVPQWVAVRRDAGAATEQLPRRALARSPF